MKALEMEQPHYSRPYAANYEETWQGIMIALEALAVDVDEANKETGKIDTVWVYKESEREMGMLRGKPWMERYKMNLQVTSGGEKTIVTIRSLAEEKRPGGTQAYRWSRKASTGEVEGIVLEEIGKFLGVKEQK